MRCDFDAVYDEYQRIMAQLNDCDDVTTKNAYFRQLTGLLYQMENLIASRQVSHGGGGVT